MILTPHSQPLEGYMDGKSSGILIGYEILDNIPSKQPLIKTASTGASTEAVVIAAMKAFLSSLDGLSVTSNVSPDDMKEISKTATAKEGVKSKDVTVKIASKSIRESHYFMDVSLDPIKKADKSLTMVSYLLREGYLGRYMIKRCFYFLPSNTSEAEETYAELVRKSEAVKRRYLQGDTKPFEVLPQVKAFLDGVKGDFEFKEENDIGTTIHRGEGYHQMEGPTYAKPPYSNNK